MNIPEIFAENVFNEEVMKKTLPSNIFNSLRSTVEEGVALDITVAQAVADAMKNWAISKGATHYTHWFQPMTGITAEKHDSFISPLKNGSVIMEFSGKELIKGESDASSFPNGGMRATFEARGYTAWDPSSYAFVKDNTLYIPTAFCSYSGESLDKKTPLLRSSEALNKQVLRILNLFGNNDVKNVKVTVGPEQEYFLIDKDVASKREDIIFTGRTLFGAKPPKGQELDDHYYGTIKPKVKAFMEDLNKELWRLGILAKTEHNEAAPAQHELAPIYTTVNIATDNNQLTMELMKKIADKHNLICLLAEKPFNGVSGSGKHNNWSITTDTGVNLFEQGETPTENLQFLLFISAVIKATDDYQDILRASVASAGNDHRLGSSEAPPAIISIYLGDDLYDALTAFENNESYKRGKNLMKLGAKILPVLPKDTTDRNRTSPLAFTGNKFEFRMVGASDSIADCNVTLNTIVAEALSIFADKLENSKDVATAVHDIIVETFKKHKRILFNGNNYSEEWVEEAEKRGLLHLKTTPDALNTLTLEKNVALFEKHKVLSETELTARQHVMFQNYSRVIRIESLTMIDMAKKQIYPAINSYIRKLYKSIKAKDELGAVNNTDKNIAKKLSELNEKVYETSCKLDELLKLRKQYSCPKDKAFFFKDKVLPTMVELRKYVDEAEKITDESCWPFPSYAKLLFSVK
ncbi:MAG: glutamine synthetase III [Clostridia bacterium]|nr:glutamine synthetase III [Clostridia bacterium]